MSTRQQVLNKIFQEGIDLTGVEFDKKIKMYNEFQMPITARLSLIINDLKEFERFAKFLKNDI